MNVEQKVNERLLLLLLGLTVGCGTGATDPPVKSPTVLPDVYVAGFELNSSGTKVAMIWKNGVPTALTDGTHGAYATSISVSGNNVYVSGVESNGTHDVVELWTNGVAMALTDGTFEGFAGQVAISGTDIYVAGGQYGVNAQNSYISVAGYWENGVFTTLLMSNSQGENGGSTGPIVVQGNDVYVAGDEVELTQTSPNNFASEPVAMYWKNGVPVLLTDGLSLAVVNSMVVVGGDVYVAGGHCLTTNPDCLNATYWKNGVETGLSMAAGSELSGIALSGTNVFASGNQPSSAGTLAEYWINGAPTTLYNSSVAAANGIATLGSDVYVVGAQIGGACYWKNGFLYSVTGGEYPSAGYAIAVVQP